MAASDNKDNIINYAGDFRLKVCKILSYRKAEGSEKAFRINILPQTMNISIVESVLMPTITGHLDIVDGQDFRTLLPITGLERLELHIFTPGQQEIKFLEESTGTLNVYKLEKIRISGGTARQQVYRLHFTSREAYKNSIMRVSRSFSGPIEDAVFELLQSPKYLDSRRPLYVEATSTNSKYVIPNLKPIKTINYLASQAISQKYKNAGYLFYETTKGFNFRSLESLYAMSGTTARPVKEQYAMQPARQRTDKGDIDVIKDLQSPDSYSFEDVANVIEELNEGLLANRLVVHDIYEKRITTFDYDYHEKFGDYFHTEHTDGGKTFTKWMRPFAFFEDTQKTLSDFPMAKLMSVTDTKKVHNDYEFSKPEDVIPNTIAQRVEMANFHLLMTVPGQTRMNCGDMISFALPIQRPVPHDAPQNLNPYYSGRYMILSLKHKFDVIEQKHLMNIRAVKDAVATDLPLGNDTVTTLTDRTGAYDLYTLDDY